MKPKLEMLGVAPASEARLPAAPVQTSAARPHFLGVPPKPGRDMKPLAHGLALLSLGLGLAAVAAPRWVASQLGVRRRHRGLIRAIGVREVGHAMLIWLQPKRPVLGVWSRLAGDAMDLTAMGTALSDPGTDRSRAAAAMSMLATMTVADIVAARELSRNGHRGHRAINVTKSITINRPAETLYNYWHNFENLPQFMEHLESVRVTGPGRSHWVAKAPAGMAVEWDAEITAERPNESLSWRSIEGAQVPNWGTVRFEPAPAGRGTVVTVALEYQPPAGKLGAAVARLFGEEPAQQVQGDLRRFKQVMETGEPVRSEGTLRGTRAFDQRPARPAGNGHRS